ncbi:MAG: hypothetical protein AB7P99_07540 [Vicinamibacterales bacterium]
MTRCVLMVAALLAGAAPLAAQTAPPFPASQEQAPSPGDPAFLSRFAFHLNAEHLSGDDDRFVWDTQFGGEIDLVDFGAGRGTFYANYQAILGEQFRRFDPSHGNYLLGGVLVGRAAGLEIGGVFHHESRHLSDRPKRFAIDWNMLGARVRRIGTAGDLGYDARAEVRKVIFKSYVDYTWDAEGEVRLRQPLTRVMSAIAGGTVRLVGTDGSRDRGMQTGARGEGGIRLDGRGAAAELFVAVERRTDPDPLEFFTANWFTVGFRLVSK